MLEGIGSDAKITLLMGMNKYNHVLPYSTKFWRGNILADLVDLPATAKNLLSKLSTLTSNANYGTA